MLEFFYFTHIERFFQSYLKKNVLEMFQYTQTSFTPPIIFLGYFLIQSSFFYFLSSSYQKKCAPSEVFFHKISPNWPIRQAETTVRGGCGGGCCRGGGGGQFFPVINHWTYTCLSFFHIKQFNILQMRARKLSQPILYNFKQPGYLPLFIGYHS